MADTLTVEQRSERMSKIRSKNTKIEVRVRKHLFSLGYRYRINDKRYSGKPDIVLPKYKTIIFIHGCFWHHHTPCKIGHIPKSKPDFWKEKFQRNIENDKKHENILKEQGWKVITLWECEITSRFKETMERVIAELNN